MDRLFAKIPQIGDLYYRRIYLFYDVPQIFSCVTKDGQDYFVIAIPAECDDDEAWLIVPMSPKRLLEAEGNEIEIRDILLHPESLVWRVEKSVENVSTVVVPPDTFEDEVLPECGEMLGVGYRLL